MLRCDFAGLFSMVFRNFAGYWFCDRLVLQSGNDSFAKELVNFF